METSGDKSGDKSGENSFHRAQFTFGREETNHSQHHPQHHPSTIIISSSMSDDDPFAAFGDDSETDSDDKAGATNTDSVSMMNEVALSVAQWCLQHHRTLQLSHMVVGILVLDKDNYNGGLSAALEAKGLTLQKHIQWSPKTAETSLSESSEQESTDPKLCDVILVPPTINSSFISEEISNFLASRLDRGGLLMIPKTETEETGLVHPSAAWDAQIWNTDYSPPSLVSWTALTKWPCVIQIQACPWLPTHNAQTLSIERTRVADATVPTSVHEQSTQRLSSASVDAACRKLQTHGYCIISGILDPTTSHRWGTTALQDLAAAARILEQQHGIHLFQPHLSTQDPASYRELSMREDLRMDLRHGPALDELRGPKGCTSWTISASDPAYTTVSSRQDQWFRGHPDLLTIVGRVMNPKKDHLSKGNFGRYNFQGGGPDGSFQNLRVGPVGAIINLPGSADQAIHADTPHLFEHMDKLPAHYINAFTPGCPAHPRVGQTAFVHASHSLEFCAKYMNDDDDEPTTSSVSTTKDSWKQFLVRPMLEMGDVVLFDCRILHFGMANAPDTNIQRPLLYTNMTQAWFIDPKNWDNETRIFPE